MDSDYEALKKVIDYIQSKYEEIALRWKNCEVSKFNLKQKRVSDITIGQDIYMSIVAYTQLLNKLSADISVDLSSICSQKVTARVKAPNSIEYKIQNYKGPKHENGEIPINKCLNDLFGVRIILNSQLTFQSIREFVLGKFPYVDRCIDSSKGEYKATHIYFKLDNYSFPWELQVWNRHDENSNLISHKKYKQEYTLWEKENKEGGILND